MAFENKMYNNMTFIAQNRITLAWKQIADINLLYEIKWMMKINEKITMRHFD